MLAIFGVIMNCIWAFLWILAMWGVFNIWAGCSGRDYCTSNTYSVPGIFTMAATYLSCLGLFGSYTLSLYEGKKRSTIRPLKITAVACLAYEELYSVIKLFVPTRNTGYGDDRFAILAYFTGTVWFIVMIIAVVISKRESDALYLTQNKEKETSEKPEETAVPAPQAKKTDEELRAEIEEKVRREIIEKEVREKVEKEMAEKKAIEENKS